MRVSQTGRGNLPQILQATGPCPSAFGVVFSANSVPCIFPMGGGQTRGECSSAWRQHSCIPLPNYIRHQCPSHGPPRRPSCATERCLRSTLSFVLLAPVCKLHLTDFSPQVRLNVEEEVAGISGWVWFCHGPPTTASATAPAIPAPLPIPPSG